MSTQPLRQAINFAVFLGPAIVLLALFFIAPVVVDLVIAFTDLGRTVEITEFTTKNFERMVTRDSRLVKSLGLTFVYVLGTLTRSAASSARYGCCRG
jgi:inositol-phosphate transport system permease protein